VISSGTVRSVIEYGLHLPFTDMTKQRSEGEDRLAETKTKTRGQQNRLRPRGSAEDMFGFLFRQAGSRCAGRGFHLARVIGRFKHAPHQAAGVPYRPETCISCMQTTQPHGTRYSPRPHPITVTISPPHPVTPISIPISDFTRFDFYLLLKQLYVLR